MLTTVLDLPVVDADLVRLVASKLGAEGFNQLAVELLERVLFERPEQPQSYRDLALALAFQLEAILAEHGPKHMSLPDREAVSVILCCPLGELFRFFMPMFSSL